MPSKKSFASFCLVYTKYDPAVFLRSEPIWTHPYHKTHIPACDTITNTSDCDPAFTIFRLSECHKVLYSCNSYIQLLATMHHGSHANKTAPFILVQKKILQLSLGNYNSMLRILGIVSVHVPGEIVVHVHRRYLFLGFRECTYLIHAKQKSFFKLYCGASCFPLVVDLF